MANPQAMMRKWMPGILVLLAFAISVVVFPKLPDRVPIHWGVEFQPNGWAGRLAGAFGLPLVMAVLWGLMILAPTVDPRKANYPGFAGSYAFVYLLMLGAALAMHVMSLAVAVGYAVPVRRVLPAILGCLFLGLGTVLPRIPANGFMGVRSPWTRTDDEVWLRTQRLGGYLFVITGVLFLVDAVVVSTVASIVSLVALLASVAVTIVYSYGVSNR